MARLAVVVSPTPLLPPREVVERVPFTVGVLPFRGGGSSTVDEPWWLTTTSDADPPCVECEEAKRTAAAKAAVAAASEAAAGDHLQLGECAPVYKAWAKCVEANAGQAKACAESLREFQKCHAQLFRGKR